MSKKKAKKRTNLEIYNSIRRDWGEVKPYTRVEEDKRFKKPKHRKGWEEMLNKLYYRVVLYNDNTILPLLFNSWEEANNYINMKKLHAYITIM